MLISKCDSDFANHRKSHGDKYMWSEINGQEVDKRFNAEVALE